MFRGAADFRAAFSERLAAQAFQKTPRELVQTQDPKEELNKVQFLGKELGNAKPLRSRREFDDRAFKGAARRATPLKAWFCVRTAHAKPGYRTHVRRGDRMDYLISIPKQHRPLQREHVIFAALTLNSSPKGRGTSDPAPRLPGEKGLGDESNLQR